MARTALNYDKIAKALFCRQVNIWQFNLQGSTYVYTPAHLIIELTKNQEKFSSLPEELKSLTWKCPASYLTHPSPLNNFSWAKIDADPFHSLEFQISPITQPTNVNIVFRYPDDHTCEFPENKSILCYKKATLYNQNTLQSQCSSNSEEILIANDIDCRGITGAIALNSTGECIGILVESTSTVVTKPNIKKPIKKMDYNFIERWIQKALGTDKLLTQLDYLVQNTLTVEDIHEKIGLQQYIYHGKFIPVTILTSINTCTVVNISDVI